MIIGGASRHRAGHALQMIALAAERSRLMPAIYETMIRCPACGGTVEGNAVECPQCGVVIARNRIRPESERPTGEVLAEATSDNLMGNYQIRQMPDGSLFCNCLSFLGQRGTQNGNGFATCKHIRRYHEDNPASLVTIQEPVRPSEYQKAALRRLGVENLDLVTNDQAYWIFKELLRKQGVTYKEYKFLMGRHNSIELLPVFSFGAEFELGIDPSHGRNGLCRKMTEVGLDTTFRGYTHDVMASWKVVTDASVSVPGCENLELVTPKLFGAEGFGKMRLALQTCNGMGSKVNSTCGMHVHVDAYWSRQEVLELAKMFLKVEQKIFWPLVPPSRRNNEFAKRLTRQAIEQGLQTADYSTFHRYHSLNLNAFSRYKTVEFRLHSGTTDPERTINWLVFLLKTCDWVKRGGRSTQIDLPSLTIGSYLDLIGMGESATSRLRRSREYIQERYNFWMQDAAMNPANRWRLDNECADDLTLQSAPTPRRSRTRRATVPPATPRRATATEGPPPLSGSRPAESIFDDDEVAHVRAEGTFEERATNLAKNVYNAASISDGLPGRLFDDDVHFTRQDTVAYQARSFRPTRQISFDDLAEGENTRNWYFASQSSNSTHNTTLSSSDDGNVMYGVLECSCQGFRTHGWCVHTISVARYYVCKEYAARRIRAIMPEDPATTGRERRLSERYTQQGYESAALARGLSTVRYCQESENYDTTNQVSVGYLAFNRHPTRRIPFNQVSPLHDPPGQIPTSWVFPSESNNTLFHRVQMTMQHLDDNVLDAALNCTCQAWRSRRYCVHTINVARYLTIREHYRRRQ